MPFLRKISRARPSGLPPSKMSTPRPAMLVATVTAPGRPACAMLVASFSCCLAFRTLCGTPRRFSMPDSISDVSMATVPNKTGRPCLFMSSDFVDHGL